jgi:GH15 family glucan-1,4-alpha-glucosidase
VVEELAARFRTRRDAAGYADLRSYAAIGDLRTVALVANDGSVDWLPLPDLDAMPVFARLLDAADGGSFRLAPADPFTTERRYLPGTAILVTTYTTDRGVVEVTDSLNLGATGRLPWSEFARVVTGVRGSVDMVWEIAPGTGLGAVSPWLQPTGNGPVLRMDAVTMAVRTEAAGDPVHHERHITGRFATSADSQHLVALVAARGEPVRMADPAQIRANVRHTRAAWERWSAQFTYDGPWRDEALRTMVMLKLLAHRQTGAIAAAATTSLPESAAGGKNWDYRLAWLRDATYTLHCLLAYGEFEDVHASVSWLLRVAREHDGDLPVLARLDGTQPGSVIRHDVPGWRGIGPVVTGNPAAAQLQLGVYGDLFDLVRTYVHSGNVLDLDSARFLAAAADTVCDIWQQPDSGMWELPEIRHYTSSKMACWQALTYASELADNDHLSGNARRWRGEAERIRRWIGDHCWSPERRAYTWYAGTTELDASVLLHARKGGFDAGDRMSTTVDALLAELSAGPLMYRFSRAHEQEKTFTACAFWVVTALAHLDRRDEASQRMNRLIPLANDVGLWSEMLDEHDHTFWGNLPQALSHLALTTAITALS